MESVDKVVDQIGETIVDVDAITPSMYFDHVKGLKTKLDETEYAIIIDNALTMLEKTKKTGQLAMAKKLAHQAELALREIEAARQGFNIFVLRKDIETYIDKIEDKPVKVIELSRYSREIPDDKIDIIGKARDIFDELYIVYTDYALKDTKKVAKHRRDKDPIVFGAFIDKTSNKEDTIYVEDRMFFITDWVEEKCDLTLEEIVRYTSDKMGKTITYTVPTTESGVRQINNYLKSFTVDKDKEDIKLKPTEIFKKKVTKAVSKLKKTTRGRKKKTDEE